MSALTLVTIQRYSSGLFGRRKTLAYALAISNPSCFLRESSRCIFLYRRNGSSDHFNGESFRGDHSNASTTHWKRRELQKIGDKFRLNMKQNEENTVPLIIENYDDVQSMWKEMESRVTRRKSLTQEERGGVSGRRNVKRSDEDVWLEAGVYDPKSKDAPNDEDEKS